MRTWQIRTETGALVGMYVGATPADAVRAMQTRTGATPPVLPAIPHGSLAHPAIPAAPPPLRHDVLAHADEVLRRAREAFNLFEQQVLDLDASCADLGFLTLPDELARLIDRYKGAGNTAVMLGGVGPTIDAAGSAMAPILVRVPQLANWTKWATERALSANLALQNVVSLDIFDFNAITTKARCAQVSAWAHQMASAYSGALRQLEYARETANDAGAKRV